MLISVHQLSKEFNDEYLFQDVQFTLDNYEKMAIVGNNGSGKTTLLKILIGELEPTNGLVSLGQGQSIGYLSQYQVFDGNLSIYDAVYQSNEEIISIEKNLNEVENLLSKGNAADIDLLIKKQQDLLERFKALDGYSYKSEVIGILKGLGFTEPEFTREVNLLSGGEKTRLSLACILLKKPDLLILDEPTNHLDIDSVKWLENYLKNYKGAIIVVSHDRYFLDQFVEKIIEIDMGKGYLYPGNYSKFRVLRQARIDQMEKEFINQQRVIKHEEAVIEKLKSFNREKSIKRANSRQKLLDKLTPVEKPVQAQDHFKLEFQTSTDSGKDVLIVKDLSKSFNDKPLLKNINFHIRRGEHVALIGGNGTGKSTLLKAILGDQSIDAGEIRIGQGVLIGYYSQQQESLNPEDTIFEAFHNSYPEMTNTEVRNILAAFLFTEDDVYKRIDVLSGGEKARVALSILMMSQANFLVLDEPTNHLDMAGKEVLEQALNKYPKTILYVSHDRYFINQTAQQILHIDNCEVKLYLGNYDHFLEKYTPITQINESTIVEDSDRKNEWQAKKKREASIRKIENDILKLEKKIETIEKKLEEIQNQMNDSSITSNSEELLKLSLAYDNEQKLLESHYQRWEELHLALEEFN